MRYQDAADLPPCEAQLIFFFIENKDVTRIIQRAGNGLETSKLLCFASFLHIIKEQLTVAKV